MTESSDTTWTPDEVREWIGLLAEGNADGAYNLANTLEEADAITVIREQLYRFALDRGVTEAALNLGLFLDDENRQAEAHAMMLEAVELGDSYHAPLWLAWDTAESGDYEAAVTWARQSTDVEQASPILMRALRELGRTDEARAFAALHRHENPVAAAEWASEDDVTPAEAIPVLEAHLANGHDDVLIPLACQYSELGDTDKEIELLRRSVELGEPNARHNLGAALYRSGREAEGLEHIWAAAKAGDSFSLRWLKRRKLFPRKLRDVSTREVSD